MRTGTRCATFEELNKLDIILQAKHPSIKHLHPFPFDQMLHCGWTELSSKGMYRSITPRQDNLHLEVFDLTWVWFNLNEITS